MRSIQKLAAFSAGALTIAGSVIGAAAQEATPVGLVEAGRETFPAAIYEGTCDSLAEEPAYQLAGLTYAQLGPDSLMGGIEDATPMAGQMAAQDDVVPVAVATTALDLNMTELFVKDRQYAVGVSNPDSGELIACANLGGPLFQDAGETRTVLESARLLSGLRDVNDSGYGGVVWVETPEGGMREAEATSTIVTVFLVPPEEGA